MSHTVIITTPPSDDGGDDRVAAPVVNVKVTVEYVPDHGLTAEQEHRNIHKVERLSSAFYAKLQEKLLEPGE